MDMLSHAVASAELSMKVLRRDALARISSSAQAAWFASIDSAESRPEAELTALQ